MDGNQATPTPERQVAAPESSAEQILSDKLEAKAAPASAESSANGPKSDDGAAVAQAQLASVTSDDGTAAAQDPAAAAVPAPLVADDVDVIEPEWVKKAEEAVAAHREDPRAEESAVEELQRDYLKTRYNLDVKSSDEKT